MARSRRFNVLLVRGDGTRVLRLTLPRWVIGITLGGVAVGIALVATSLGAIYSDYLSLRHQRDTMSVLLPRLAEQQGLLESYQSRVRDWSEIASWSEVHARIFAAFGPDAGLSRRGAGIGGGTATSALDGRGPRRREGGPVPSCERGEGGGGQSAGPRTVPRPRREDPRVIAVALAHPWLAQLLEFGRRASPWAASSEFHSGIDIGASIGTEVKAPAPGTVIFAGRQAEYGVTLIIDHGNDTKSLYGHLSRLNVATDQKIQRGDLLAFSGNTGRSSGPHLHYEIQVRGQPVNPHTYLWE